MLTIGHSNRPAAEFIETLRTHRVETLVDVRTLPRSRHNPQFGKEELAPALAQAGIAYVHLPALGGLRRPRPDSPNTGWRNASFRGYADYMGTPAFAAALEELIALDARNRAAIMCAEAVPWRCHRSLIADALTARGIAVEHILNGRLSPHKLTPFARLEGSQVSYPPEQPPLDLA